MDPNIFVKVWSLKLSNTTYVKTSMTSSCNEQKKKKNINSWTYHKLLKKSFVLRKYVNTKD